MIKILKAILENLVKISVIGRSLLFELREIKELLKSYEIAEVIEFYSDLGGINKKVDYMFLKVTQTLPLSIAIKDKFGNAAKVDGAPKWALTNEALGALTVSEDGMSASFAPAGTVGSLSVQVTCDADLGEGVKTIVGELAVELLAGDAETVEVSAGEAV